MGLTLISGLASSFEISGGSGRGTKIKANVPLAAHADGASEPTTTCMTPAQGAEVKVGAPELVGPVMERIFSAMATRQDMTIDRVSDGLLLTDAISAAVRNAFTDHCFGLVVTDRPGEVSVKVGPMSAGAGAEIRARLRLPGGEGTLESLADEVEILSEPDGEYLTARLLAVSSKH